jgi:alkanesulfonate monooxygenase
MPAWCSPDHKILLGCLVVGDTAEEARDKWALLESLGHPDTGIASLSIALGHDAFDFGLARAENRFFSNPSG